MAIRTPSNGQLVGRLANVEFRAALQRVGVGLRKNGEWLLRFIDTPLESKGPHTVDRELLWHDLLALGLLACRGESAQCGQELNEQEQRLWRSATDFYGSIWSSQKPLEHSFEYGHWWKSIRHLQRTVGVAIGEVLKDGETQLRLPDVIYEIKAPGKGQLTFPLDRLTIDAERGSATAGATSAVLLRLKHVLDSFISYISVCKCETFFIKRRADQQYCTRQCQMRHLMQTKRATQEVRSRPGNKRPK